MVAISFLLACSQTAFAQDGQEFAYFEELASEHGYQICRVIANVATKEVNFTSHYSVVLSVATTGNAILRLSEQIKWKTDAVPQPFGPRPTSLGRRLRFGGTSHQPLLDVQLDPVQLAPSPADSSVAQFERLVPLSTAVAVLRALTEREEIMINIGSAKKQVKFSLWPGVSPKKQTLNCLDEIEHVAKEEKENPSPLGRAR